LFVTETVSAGDIGAISPTLPGNNSANDFSEKKSHSLTTLSLGLMMPVTFVL
jgi:hypothetical protein